MARSASVVDRNGEAPEQGLRREVERLRSELDQKSAEVELLHEVTARVAAAADTEGMLQFIAEIAVRVTETDSSSIYVFDQTKKSLILKAVHDAPHGLIGRLTLRIGEGITGWVARELLPVAIEREAS